MNQTSHEYEYDDDAPEPGSPEYWARRELTLRAFKRTPSMSLTEAARRGIRWAVRRVAELSRPVTSAAGAALSEGDRRFLTWLANAAIAFYLSENQSIAEG